MAARQEHGAGHVENGRNAFGTENAADRLHLGGNRVQLIDGQSIKERTGYEAWPRYGTLKSDVKSTEKMLRVERAMLTGIVAYPH